MKQAGCAILVIAMGLDLPIAVILVDRGDGENDKCLPGGSKSAGGGDPAGQYSLPEENAMDSVTSEFGLRGGAPHQGIDIAQGEGTPIYAFADGVVAQRSEARRVGKERW